MTRTTWIAVISLLVLACVFFGIQRKDINLNLATNIIPTPDTETSVCPYQTFNKTKIEYVITEIYGKHFKVVPNKWWTIVKKGTWEHTTFTAMDQFLRKDMIYIGFGTWIGPMLLYAGSIAKRAYGFEPDLFAFREVCQNIAYNPEYPISVSNICISNTTEVLEMTGNGESGSIVNKKASGKMDSRYLMFYRKKLSVWNVKCQPIADALPYLPKNEQLFVKVDAEGAESFILPSWRTWLFSFETKPSLLISFHGASSNKQKMETLSILKTYAYHIVIATGNSYESRKFKKKMKCWDLISTTALQIPEWGDIFVSDIKNICS